MSQVTQSATLGQQVQELLQILYHHARGMWRFRWWALLCAWLLAPAIWVFAYLLPNEYGASARVYVDTENVLRPLLRGLAVETDVMNDVAVMTRALLSRPSLERVARETDLDLRAESPIEMERMLNSIRDRIRINRSRDNIFVIDFHDQNRQMAEDVVDALLNAFVEDTMGNKEADTEEAEQTLREQIDAYEQRLTEAEGRLETFKRENVGRMPGDRGDYFGQLQTALEELESIERQIQVTSQKRDVLEQQLSGERPAVGVPGQPRPLERQIGELESRLNALRIEYTDQHPEVRRVKSILNELRERQRRVLESPGNLADAASQNPVYQEIKVQLSSAQVELAALETERAQKQRRVEQLREMVDVIPQVEAELKRLNRDYDVVQSRYSEMLQRLENLRTSQRARTGAESVRFRVIDPPHAPRTPAGPPRELYIAGGLVFALGAGVALALVLNLLNPVITHVRDFSAFGVPVLGAVRMQSDEGRFRRWAGALALFSGGAGVLVIAAVLVLMFEDQGSELLRSVVGTDP